MPSERHHLALLDIRENALLARAFTVGMSLEEFKADRRTFYAVTRCMEIVSEAARRLLPEVRDRYPELPWRTIQISLDPLLAAIDSEIANLPGTP